MKGMTVICINGEFTQLAREIYEKYGVVTPQEGVLYNIREVVNTRYGIGLLLEELVNPKMYCHNIGEVEMWAEPNFKISRFTNVDGTEINTEELRNETKDTGVTT